MSEPHLDHPGEIHWFKGETPHPVLGPCPHTTCKHLGQGVIAHGPSYERYELVECGIPGDGGCGAECRAWVDGNGQVATAWLHVQVPLVRHADGTVTVDRASEYRYRSIGERSGR